MSRANSHDAIVVGGGSNGLVAAGYLARAGLRTVLLERRGVLGGAAVSEQPFGPDYTVTSLSYVVSLLPADIVADLRLSEHGYLVYPQGPYFAPHADGGYLQLPAEPARRAASIARFSADDVEGYQRYQDRMAELAGVLGPLLAHPPPKLGSKRPGDLAAQAALAWRLRGLDSRRTAEATRLFTLSMADLLAEFVSSPQLQGVLSVSGVIGTWAGPRSHGTAYVMLHHHVGDQAWGFPQGGMGGVTAAMAAAARSYGAQLRTDAAVQRITTAAGRVTGVVLAGGEELQAATVVVTTHPKIAFLDLLDRDQLPADFVADIERWKTRSGTVKVTWPWTGCRSSPPSRGTTRRCTAARSCWPSRSRTWRPASRTRSPGAPAPRRSPTSPSRRSSTRRWRRRAATSSRCSPSGCPQAGRRISRRRGWTRTPTG